MDLGISHGALWHLSRIEWQLFGGLTFRGRVPSAGRAYGHAWNLFQAAARRGGVPYSELLIALRAELGERGGRPHFHFLLAGLDVCNLRSFSFWLRHKWAKEVGAFGHCRQFDTSLRGVSYVTKCLGGGDVYELQKFARSAVCISRSLARVLAGLDRMATGGRSGSAKTAQGGGVPTLETKTLASVENLFAKPSRPLGEMRVCAA